MASNSQPKRLPTREVLLAVEARLIEWDIFEDDSRIRWWQRDEPAPHLVAEKDIILNLGGIVPEDDQIDAAGVVDTRVRRQLNITCRSRLNLDAADNDKQWLLHDELGISVFEDQVLNAMLSDFWPHDANGNALTAEIVRLMPNSRGPVKHDESWGESTLSFLLVFQPDLVLDV